MKTIATKPKRKKFIFKRVGISGLKKDLAGFEKKHSMSTQTFLQKIDRGELSECNDFIDWLGLAKLHQEIIAANGKEVFRYDNFEKHPGIRAPYHHKHISKRRAVQLEEAPKLIDVIEEAVRYMF